jgi:hypothetical protein
MSMSVALRSWKNASEDRVFGRFQVHELGWKGAVTTDTKYRSAAISV